jgi:hypothetical protein
MANGTVSNEQLLNKVITILANDPPNLEKWLSNQKADQIMFDVARMPAPGSQVGTLSFFNKTNPEPGINITSNFNGNGGLPVDNFFAYDNFAFAVMGVNAAGHPIVTTPLFNAPFSGASSLADGLISINSANGNRLKNLPALRTRTDFNTTSVTETSTVYNMFQTILLLPQTNLEIQFSSKAVVPAFATDVTQWYMLSMLGGIIARPINVNN